MLTIATTSLAGGQGKTTAILFLAKALAKAGYSVLLVDADPQHTSTDFLGVEVQPNEPTLLEVLRGSDSAGKSVGWEDGVYPTTLEKLFLMPSDDSLEQAQEYLSASGIGALLLRKRLKPVSEAFQICLIDSPPQRYQISRSVIVAADQIIIPVEAAAKGYVSLTRTLDAIDELKQAEVCHAEILGVLPFRDRWTGQNQSVESKSVIELIKKEVGKDLLLPSILESEQYKKCLRSGILASDLPNPDLEYPFQVILEKVALLLAKEQKA